MEAATVLLAEDELALAHIVCENLEERGYNVILCANGRDALERYKDAKPNILVLDIMMPLMDGFAVAKAIRKDDQKTPIIFLTAKSQPKDVVAGFELGANDYLKKPFSIEELIIRIQVQLSKHGILKSKDTLKNESFRFGEFTFLPRKNTLEYGVLIKQLTSRESEVLKLLCQNHQRVIAHTVILKEIWGNDNIFTARSLDVFISKLRRHLSNDPSVQIINVRGVGYKLVH